VRVTAFLRAREAALGAGGPVEASLELHSGFEADTVDVGGRQVPLETDRSVVLAHMLDRPEPWRFSLSGFFQGESATEKNALCLIQPYTRGRVPVVFVHGTASSPAYWAELFNTLWFDPVLRQRAQFWFFRYATGNPIAYSAAELRDDLALAVQTLDPEGTDPALRQMVLIGHSQGGLLVKMCAMGSDLAWVEGVLGSPVEEYGFDADELALIKRCFVFEPSPFVSRVVFVCTPHRGSFMAAKWYSRFVASLVAVPQELSEVGDRLFADEARLPEELRGRSFTSVGGMDPDNPLQKHIADTPLAPRVAAHSIIAIGDADPRDPAAVQAADDGVVEYASAHIEGVESEDLVPAKHSCQSHPVTIESLRRILLEHLKGTP
jgi:pimeloyl-ACP methyl ester carboxylesterase